jgi:Zn-dependent oligopeptidase
LLHAAETPAFSEIRPEHVTPAIALLLAEAGAALERAVGPEVALDYDAICWPSSTRPNCARLTRRTCHASSTS